MPRGAHPTPPEPDPHSVSTEGFEDQLGRLGALNDLLESAEWQALTRRASELDARAYFGHVNAVLQASNLAELEGAFAEFEQAIEGLDQ